MGRGQSLPPGQLCGTMPGPSVLCAAPFSCDGHTSTPSPSHPASTPDLDWYGRLPSESWSEFSLLKPTGSLELEESFPFSVCLPLCLACALWHVLPGGSLSQRLRAQVRRLPLRPWLPGGGACVLLVSSRRLPVCRKRRCRSSSSPGIWWQLHQPRTVTQLLGGAPAEV